MRQALNCLIYVFLKLLLLSRTNQMVNKQAEYSVQLMHSTHKKEVQGPPNIDSSGGGPCEFYSLHTISLHFFFSRSVTKNELHHSAPATRI